MLTVQLYHFRTAWLVTPIFTLSLAVRRYTYEVCAEKTGFATYTG